MKSVMIVLCILLFVPVVGHADSSKSGGGGGNRDVPPEGKVFEAIVLQTSATIASWEDHGQGIDVTMSVPSIGGLAMSLTWPIYEQITEKYFMREKLRVMARWTNALWLKHSGQTSPAVMPAAIAHQVWKAVSSWAQDEVERAKKSGSFSYMAWETVYYGAEAFRRASNVARKAGQNIMQLAEAGGSAWLDLIERTFSR